MKTKAWVLSLYLLALGTAWPPSAFAISQAQISSEEYAFLNEAYLEIRREAVVRAGTPLDMPQRTVLLRELYLDSKGNHAFPLVALHGALWGYHFFKISGPVGEAISFRYFYNSEEMARRKGMLEKFSVAFQDTNRSVFIDTYTNYYFSKVYGHYPGAGLFVEPELLEMLGKVHRAAREVQSLNAEEKRRVFEKSLYFEQERTVGPKIRSAVDQFDCPVLKYFGFQPFVRFSYFPIGYFFHFQDFSDQRERIAKAMAAFDIAAQVGWEKVLNAIEIPK